MGKNDKKNDKNDKKNDKNVFSKAGKGLEKTSNDAGKGLEKTSNNAGKGLEKTSNNAGKGLEKTSNNAGKSSSSNKSKPSGVKPYGDETPSAPAPAPNQFYIDGLLKQISDAEARIVSLNAQITTLTTQNATLTTQNAELNAQLAQLRTELANEKELYNTYFLLYNNALEDVTSANNERDIARDAQLFAEFNQEASETQTLITDLNQPYVTNGDNLVAMLSKYIPKSNADATYTKIQYRDVEYSKLKNINTIINGVYYFGVIFLFILLFTSNNFYLKERFMFYIFLILLPFLYPWLYLYVTKIWRFLFPVSLLSGPKNAFIDESTQPNVYDI
jgi:hypothetical protein